MEYRGYKIVPVHNLMGYTINYDGKGSVHGSLQGMFTSRGDAQKFIDIYLRGKEEVDGETDTTSGSEQVQRRAYHRRKPADES